MIFTAENAELILAGKKTQTRRIVKAGETFDDGIRAVWAGRTLNSRIKWQVGKDYAVQPGRGRRSIWWRMEDGWPLTTYDDDLYDDYKHWTKKALALHGWRELRIRITAIRQERLQDITAVDAIAEGAPAYFETGREDMSQACVAGFARLWDSIHAKQAGERWADSPEVWALTFELVRE